MADDDGPRLDVAGPFPAGLGAVAEADPPVVGAGVHEGGGGVGVRPRGRGVRRGRGGPPDGLGLRGDRLGERLHDLAERAADQGRGIAGVVVAVEHGHDQAEGLGGAERQRRQPQAASDPVAAVGPADGDDRDPGLPQDADVAPGGAFGDAELAGEPVGGDARPGLEEFEGAQRPRRRACVVRHGNSRFRKWIVRNGS